MAAVTGKRKRADVDLPPGAAKKTATALDVNGTTKTTSTQPNLTRDVDFHDRQKSMNGVQGSPPSENVFVQIVAGSYERVLHGICARIPGKLLRRTTGSNSDPQQPNGATSNDEVSFSDTFLFAAHSSSIRCLALSPSTESGKRILATGSSDERINLYNLSTSAPSTKTQPSLPTLTSTSTSENPSNRAIGNLIHHDRAITRLHFPTRSKLFSAAEDNTIAISRTRDWTVLSSIKAPIPKPQGRPSGDTAGPGEVPAGVNDFAIHPSQKLMLSVGRGERCMRLWNLMTGKKAGVLNFEREMLGLVGEGKFGSGEARKVVWDEDGEKFVVGFERGAVVFGIDSKPRAVIKPEPGTKLHQMRFLPGTPESQLQGVLVLSTEDGRILFFDTSALSEDAETQNLLTCRCVAEMGGPAAGIVGRIKDFEILPLSAEADDEEPAFLLVAGSSDGAIRLWHVLADEITPAHDVAMNGDTDADAKINGETEGARRVVTLIGTLETGNRITCLAAFVMDGTSAEATNHADDVVAAAEENDEDESESEDSE